MFGLLLPPDLYKLSTHRWAAGVFLKNLTDETSFVNSQFLVFVGNNSWVNYYLLSYTDWVSQVLTDTNWVGQVLTDTDWVGQVLTDTDWVGQVLTDTDWVSQVLTDTDGLIKS